MEGMRVASTPNSSRPAFPTTRVTSRASSPSANARSTDSPSAAARLAAVVDAIDMRDNQESEKLLVDLLRVCWPTVWTQDQ